MTTPISVAQTLAGRELFITGTSGFLGKVLIAHLLHEVPDIGKLHLLVRPTKTRKLSVSGADRFKKIALQSPCFRPLRDRYGAGFERLISDKIIIWEGDVTEPDCGLAEAVVQRLGPVIDVVVHVAGLTDFEPDPKKALEANTLGATHVLELTSRLERAMLLHTSTCYVVGQKSGHILEQVATTTPNGKAIDPEVELAAFEALAKGEAGVDQRDPAVKIERAKAATAHARSRGFPNTYTYSKALAELLLTKKAPLNGTRRPVPLTIVRPAIIECAETFPFEGWNEGINTTGPLLWLIKSWFRHLPSKGDVRFDVVPVDTCSRAMIGIIAAMLAGKAQPVYQVGTSSTNPFTVGRAIELSNLAVRKDLGATNKKPLERWGQRFFDTVAVGADEDHTFAPNRLRRLARDLKSLVGSAAGAIPALRKGKDSADIFLDDMDKSLGRVQRMLDLYRPFIHDNNWSFDNRNVRALDALMDDDSRARFGWAGDRIDWRKYWIDVLYPGLATWSMPLLENREVPIDAVPAWASPAGLAVCGVAQLPPTPRELPSIDPVKTMLADDAPAATLDLVPESLGATL